MKKALTIVLCLLLIATVFCGCGAKTQSPEGANEPSESGTVTFTDSLGRQVELPQNLTRVSPSGSLAQMILYAVAPDSLASWAGELGDNQKAFFAEKYWNLTVTGQFFGKSDLNLEALIELAPQVIIDLGDEKSGMAEDLDAISEQTGIPTIFIKATTETYPEAFRTLGELLGQPEQGEALAKYTEEVLAEAAANREKITEDKKLSVMFGTGATGLDCNAKGSIHCGVLETVGVENAIEVSEISNKGGGNTITMEELLAADPDVLLFEAGGAYASIAEDEYWSGLTAIKNGKYYEIPMGPYHFLASPPSINQILGIRWLGNLLYPEIYDFDIVKELQTNYKLFWHYDLTEEQAKELLANSTFKK